jgi:hypothetical protein
MGKEMRILVCGGRDYNDDEMVRKVLLQYFSKDLTIIQGEARGADYLAKMWAKNYGVEYESYPADWDKYGKRAGFIRNGQMLTEGKPDLVIAFPGGKGTEMMIMLAEKAGVPVRRIEE